MQTKAYQFTRVDEATNARRSYYLALGPGLYAPYTVTRIYGRIGTWQQVLPPLEFTNAQAARNCLASLIRTRRQRGYQRRKSSRP